MPLPAPPSLPLEILEDRTGVGPGFLRLRRARLRLSGGRPFEYDCVERAAMDAAVVAAHHRGEDGVVRVWLRSSPRPPVALRFGRDDPWVLWELPAGLIEPGEEGSDGPRQAAARELREETGFVVDPARLAPLGPPVFPAPAVLAERWYFYHAEVDPSARGTPCLDGSELERVGTIAHAPLPALLGAVAQGRLPDAKTELGLRRLAEVLA